MEHNKKDKKIREGQETDMADYRKINPDFGTMEDLELLIKESQKRGLAAYELAVEIRRLCMGVCASSETMVSPFI